MEEQARNGTSINLQELSDLDQPTNPLISTTPENPITCNTTQPHQDGGKCSSIRMDTSPTSKMVRLLLFQEVKMLKVIQFGYGRDTVEDIQHKFGELLIFTNLMLEILIPRRVKYLKWDSDSKQIHHSTSDLDFQCRELQNV
jgi:hypothetical protein